MIVTTEQQFNDIMNDPATDLSTVIELPGETIYWPLNITKSCTIFGNNTTIDVSGLTYDIGLNIYVQVDISDITVINSEKKAIVLNNVKDSRFEKIRAGHSEIGWLIIDSINNEFEECEAYNNNTGIELQGSSNIIGDISSYQTLGLSGLIETDDSGLLENKEYYFKVFGQDYKFTSVLPLTIKTLIYQLNYAQRVSDQQILKADCLVTLTNGDIRFTSLTSDNINLERSSLGIDLFKYIKGFDTQEKTTIIFNDDISFSLQSKYWFLNTPNNEYYIWYNVSNGGVNPSDVGQPLEGTAKIELKIDINENEFAEDIAQKTFDKIQTILNDNEIIVELNNNEINITNIPGGNYNNSVDVNTGFNIIVNDGALDGVFGPIHNNILEDDRNDRSFKNQFENCLIHDNSIGIKLINTNTNTFTGCQIYENTNIGLWQTVVSYSNIFNGEIYGNIKYGARNTDREHGIDCTQTWWGDQTGPSGAGSGEGDRISTNITFNPWLQSGTEPELSYPETRKWIWEMLGYPQVAVELTEEQVTNAINMALDKFHYYWQPEPYYWYGYLGSNQNEIELPVEIPKESIIEVSYSPQTDIYSQLSGSGESFFLTYYMQQTNGTFLTDFYIAMAYKETFERTLGIVPSYEFITHPDANGVMKDYVRLYPAPSGSTIKVGLKVSRTLSEYEVDQQMWIRKYALTWAKENLGQIRAKFSSVPGPTGEISLKGDALIAEAQQEREALIQDIIKRSEPLGFTTG